MTQRLTLPTALLLTLLWAGNTAVGRLLSPLVPPLTLNFLRWLRGVGGIVVSSRR